MSFNFIVLSLHVSLCEKKTYLVAQVQAEEIDELMKMRKSTNYKEIHGIQCGAFCISLATTRFDVQNSVGKSSKMHEAPQ